MAMASEVNHNPSSAVSSSATSSAGGGGGGRERIERDELAIILSHYDIGRIEAIQDFPRGSRKSPKLILRTETGMYLLKRRARGKDDAYKVAFCHELQLYLASKQFPLPHLIGTRKDNNSMLQWRGAIYELFEYIKGTAYDASLEATQDAGKILALFHKLLADFDSDYEPPRGTYHNSRTVELALEKMPATLARTNPATVSTSHPVHHSVEFFNEAYQRASQRVEDSGFADWPTQFIHSDWHPGNMLFRGTRVVAVIDFDTARIQQRVLDIANGALQFSILGGSDDPTTWPEYIDESRFKRFLRGYDSVPGCVLSKAELKIVPWLMIEALIAEAVIPIAGTGAIGRMEGTAFLSLLERKVRWLEEHAETLPKALD